jgi:hypothetical protein
MRAPQRPVIENAAPLEEVAAYIDALMARDAAKRFEQLITGQLVGVIAAASPASQLSKRLPGVNRERS